MGIINEIKDGVQKNQVALDYLKENIVKVDGSPDDPKGFLDVSELIKMNQELLKKICDLELGQASLRDGVERIADQQREHLDCLLDLRGEMKHISKHFERDN